MTNLERGEGGRGRVSGECGRKLAQRRFFAPTSQLRGLDDTISVFSVTCNSTWARLVVAGLVAGLHAGDLGSPARILTRDPICTYRLLSWIAGSNVGKDGLPPRLVHVATWGVHSRTACAPAAITRVFSVTCNSTWARLVVAGLVAGLHAGDLGSPARILTRDPICTYRLLSWIAGSNVGKDGLPPRLVHVATWGVHSRTACAPAAITRAIAAAILCTAGSRQFLCLYRAAPLIRQRLSRCCSWRPPL